MSKSSKGSYMSKSLFPAVAAAVALAAGMAGSTAVWAGEGPQVSKGAAKILKAANDAYQAKNWNECVKKAQEGNDLAGRTAFDSYVANQLLGTCYQRLGNNTEAVKAIEAQLESGFMPAAQQAQFTKSLAVIHYQQKNYAKSVELGNRVIKAGGADAEIYTVVGQGLYLQNKHEEAAKFIADYVKDQESRGQQPKEQTLILLRSAYERGNNNTGSADTLEKLVMYYPKKEYWNNLLYSVRKLKLTDRQTLQVYRLMVATQTMQQPSDYAEMAELAISGGNPGEAKIVLDAGNAANVFVEPRDKDRTARMLTSLKDSTAKDQASLPKLEVEAKTAKTGDLDVALGNAYLSYGQNDKAVAALNAGITKGGLKNLADAQLTLGIAQARAGDKAGALKSFKAVKTEDPASTRIAKLWSLYVQ
ncbi:MAG: tetratricopeptide repeat protein [Microthrixaceae bacterium]